MIHSKGKQVDHTMRENKNGVNQDKSGEKPCKWNRIHLFVVCTVLPVLLFLILDSCHPSTDPSIITLSTLWDWNAAAIVISFTVLQAALYYLPVGKVEEGKMGRHEKRLTYNLNGLYAFMACLSLSLCMWQFGVFRWSSVTSRVIPMISAGSVLSLLISVALYTHSHTPTGSVFEAFALGRDLDPRIGKIDVKHFMMIRIGFNGWAMMDVCYLMTALERDGTISLSLALVVIFQLIYVFDLLIDEGSLLTTKEITEESIGFIMVLGEYIWIPFFSNVPAYFLLQRPYQLQGLHSVAIILLFSVSFLTYHMSNKQKNAFRKNPNDLALTYLKTISSPSGQDLLVSGWFGWVRHPNYLGDIMAMFAWSLPCGFSSVLPYLPALQCLNLLRQRADEMEASCKPKHGAAWIEYCKKVPYKLFPYIY